MRFPVRSLHPGCWRGGKRSLRADPFFPSNSFKSLLISGVCPFAVASIEVLPLLVSLVSVSVSLSRWLPRPGYCPVNIQVMQLWLYKGLNPGLEAAALVGVLSSFPGWKVCELSKCSRRVLGDLGWLLCHSVCQQDGERTWWKGQHEDRDISHLLPTQANGLSLRKWL